MRRITFLALVVGVGCAQTQQKPFVLGPPSSALDGNAFDVVIQNGELVRDERLSFRLGQFMCVGCDEDNFMPAPYSIEKSGDAVSFKTQSVSPTDGKYNWTGTVRGDSIQGKMVWVDKQGKSKNYTFKGERASSGEVAANEARQH